MIEMTPCTESVFTRVVAAGVERVRHGHSLAVVRMWMERDPMVSYSPFSVDEVMAEIEFWAGKPKKR